MRARLVGSWFEPLRIFMGLLIVALLAFPFAAILYRSSYLGFPLSREVAVVFGLTTLQAALSALVSLVAGVVGGVGLLWAFARVERRPAARLIEGIVLLPNAAPVVLLLLAVIKFFPWARGLAGIVLVHSLLNAGLVAVAFAQLVNLKIAGPAELAYVEGASGMSFFWRGVLPLLRNDLALLFLFVFALCFTSFSVPLVIGGSRATTIEVLIYEKIRISGDWSQALGLALMQMLAVFSLANVLRRGESIALVSRAASTPLLQWKFGLGIVLVPTFFLLLGLFDGIVSGTRQVLAKAELVNELPALIAGSSLIGFSVGFAIVMILLTLAFIRPTGLFRCVLIGYAAPSSVLTGFALLIVWRSLGLASYFKITLGLVAIVLPAFYRYQWDAHLRSLEGQVIVARTLGASSWLTFMRVVFPQTVRPACFIGGVAALWGWGDFALSSVVAERNITVAQVARGMMDSYRLEAATFLVWILMIGGLGTFAIFVGAGHVLGTKSQA